MIHLNYYLKKYFLFTLIALLVVQCQKDDTNTNVESEQLKKELSEKQKKALAKEILDSKEYKESAKQILYWRDKIKDEDFFTKDIIGENGFSRDAVKKRLSMTSFKSVDEFFQLFEKMTELNKKVIKKYPEMADPSMEKYLIEEVKEKAKREFWDNIGEKKSIDRKKNYDCDYAYRLCYILHPV